MTAAAVTSDLMTEVVTFPGADHAFFNDTGPRYDAAAAGLAWTALLDWFNRYLG